MRATPSTDPKRFETDRVALPFPAGGVFGAQAPPDAAKDEGNAMDVSTHVDGELEAVQRNLDALADALNDSIPFDTFVRDDGDDDHLPAA